MSQRRPLEDDAGPWVAWREEDDPSSTPSRSHFVRDGLDRVWSCFPRDAARADTAAKARAKVAGPRVRGARRGPSRHSDVAAP